MRKHMTQVIDESLQKNSNMVYLGEVRKRDFNFFRFFFNFNKLGCSTWWILSYY